ncbi:hypothetical protein MSAN_02309400 [Mycena sanguinolenta]|uniref:Uncharacterized protein n=1 Tax=Mycena sanguinolenta TaxID=230812 RepID=A0A8H6X8F9_9AGAR|nr:hypothetical protein MSAN_02309400 [Mycena sanguinolenta]
MSQKAPDEQTEGPRLGGKSSLANLHIWKASFPNSTRFQRSSWPTQLNYPTPSPPSLFLPPTLASQFAVSQYLYAATLGAYIWDIGLNLGNDYALLFKHRVHFPTIVYFLSRAVTFAFILTSFVYEVAPVKNCQALALGWSICIILSQTTTRMLFYLRVTAVWHPSKIVYVVFSILLIAVPSASLTAPLGIRAAHIGPTKQCITTAVPANIEVSAIMPLINDTAIFLAISYRILAHTIVVGSSTSRLRVFFGGRGLSTLSQALLQSGQHFYFVAVAANVTLLVLVKLPQLPPVYKSMLTIPAAALVNTMACLVFRKIKFGLMSSDVVSKIPTSGLSSDFHATVNRRSLSLHPRHTDFTLTEFRSDAAFPLDVRIQREIDRFEDNADVKQEISQTTILV